MGDGVLLFPQRGPVVQDIEAISPVTVVPGEIIKVGR